MNVKSVALSALLVLIPAISAAGLSGGGGGMGLEDGLFWGADLDRNERLDPSEAKAVYNLSEPEIFSRFDENGNGSISRVEFSEFMQHSPWTDPFVHPANAE
ncbi:MAG: hypothetical protein OXC41_03630 [Gammaproteobacteria bacterium]|nr:hypothetical protein [Gammaproteobacteria bacterium]